MASVETTARIKGMDGDIFVVVILGERERQGWVGVGVNGGDSLLQKTAHREN